MGAADDGRSVVYGVVGLFACAGQGHGARAIGPHSSGRGGLVGATSSSQGDTKEFGMGRVAIFSKGVPGGGPSATVERVLRDDARLDLAPARTVADSPADPSGDGRLRQPHNTGSR